MLRLLTIFVTLTVIPSCKHGTPKKPSIDSGIVILEINEVFYVNNQTGNETYLPLLVDGKVNPKLNKSVIHSNEDWNKILLYIRLMEHKLGRRTKKEIRKLNKSTTIINKEAKAHEF